MFSTIKSYLIAAGAAVVVILLTLLNYFKAKAERMEQKAREAQAKIRQDAFIRERDNEIDLEHSDARREADRDKKDGRIPKHLNDPNNWD